MPDMKSPAEWAAEKETDPALLAACSIGNRWDRNPGLTMTAADFDAALKALDDIQAGGMHAEPKKTDKQEAKKASAAEVK